MRNICKEVHKHHLYEDTKHLDFQRRRPTHLVGFLECQLTLQGQTIMSLLSDTLFRLRANQSFLLVLNVMCIAANTNCIVFKLTRLGDSTIRSIVQTINTIYPTLWGKQKLKIFSLIRQIYFDCLYNVEKSISIASYRPTQNWLFLITCISVLTY